VVDEAEKASGREPSVKRRVEIAVVVVNFMVAVNLFWRSLVCLLV
jgi:hypothetical protein